MDEITDIAATSARVRALLEELHGDFSPLFSFALRRPEVVWLDLSVNNSELAALDIHNSAEQQEYIQSRLSRAGARAGLGGYGEKRGFYRRAGHFRDGEEARDIHLGIDIWTPAGTPLLAPLSGTIHSFQDNAAYGDYGPTIILEHELPGGLRLFSLYGHLSRQSLSGKFRGQEVRPGQIFASVGSPPTNGDWPPHLHFQLMIDMLGLQGDFPGVAAESKRDYFLTLCPDPNIVLQMPA